MTSTHPICCCFGIVTNSKCKFHTAHTCRNTIASDKRECGNYVNFHENRISSWFVYFVIFPKNCVCFTSFHLRPPFPPFARLAPLILLKHFDALNDTKILANTIKNGSWARGSHWNRAENTFGVVLEQQSACFIALNAITYRWNNIELSKYQLNKLTKKTTINKSKYARL